MFNECLTGKILSENSNKFCHWNYLFAASLKKLLNTRIRNYEKSTVASKDGLKFSNKYLPRIIDDLDTLMLLV